MLDLSFDNITQWVCIAIAGLCLGFSKAGIPTVGTASIPFLIVFFNPKDFTGITLPLLFLGDALAVSYYYKDVPLKILRQLIPVIAIGLYCGYLMLKHLPGDLWILKFIGYILLVLLALRCLSCNAKINELMGKNISGGILIFISALTTTVAHAGGPFMAIYFQTKNLNKRAFLGLYATTFLLINAVKLPIYIGQSMVRSETLLYSLWGVPFIFIGSRVGKTLVNYVSQKTFDITIVTLIFVAAIRLIFKTI